MGTLLTPSDQRERGERATQGCSPVPEEGAAPADPKSYIGYRLLEVMLEVILLTMAMLAMANKRRGSARRRGFIVGAINEDHPLLTLLTNAVNKTDWADAPDDTRFLISMKAVWTASEFAVGEGPIIVGVAHGDYTATEIEEFLEVGGSWNTDDLISVERARRKIRIVGTFPLAVEGESLNHGEPIHTRLGFILGEGELLSTWAFNKGDGNLTTGGLIKVVGQAFMRRAR